MIKIKIGSICVLRDGIITEPIEASNNGTNYKFEAKVLESGYKTKSVLYWLESGSFVTNSVKHKNDIIEILN